MAVFKYRALHVREGSPDRSLVLFAAPATDIDKWAGIPQKKELRNGTETTGFQREVNLKRLESLKAFYQDDRNVIQNPLLCATRDLGDGSVVFSPDTGISSDSPSVAGELVITLAPLAERSLLQLLRAVKSCLEDRLPMLIGRAPSDLRIVRLKELAQLPASENGENDGPDGSDAENDEVTEIEDDSEERVDDPFGSVLAEESHVFDFWDDVAARVQILESLGEGFDPSDFLGYTKDALISFLMPVVVVDGQHRLRGAIEAARERASTEPFLGEIERRVAGGDEPILVQHEVERASGRNLPVSLLLTADPAEHVFQFVVVNQKATPIGRALLGTIVSTTLSNDELQAVSNRLQAAGIPLEQSRAVAYLSRHPDSPFCGLVERGLIADKKGLLPWTVLASLVRVFRDLQGGRLFHERNDYADKWHRKHLADSAIVANWQAQGFSSAFECWHRPDGPWRTVFIEFWKAVRDKLSSTTDEEAAHYWGSGRESNLFNKVSLTILEADFFQFLCERTKTIDNGTDICGIVDEWLEGVSPNYFNRDWRLEGVKKDSPGIRNQWAKLWVEYRKDPERMPGRSLYRQAVLV